MAGSSVHHEELLISPQYLSGGDHGSQPGVPLRPGKVVQVSLNIRVIK